MERSNLALCNITKKSCLIYGRKRSVLKVLKELSGQSKAIENKFFAVILSGRQQEARLEGTNNKKK